MKRIERERDRKKKRKTVNDRHRGGRERKGRGLGMRKEANHGEEARGGGACSHPTPREGRMHQDCQFRTNRGYTMRSCHKKINKKIKAIKSSI